MTRQPFTPTREDGRSDRQVIYDITHTAEPDALFTYPELADALQEGLEQPVTRAKVYRAIASANKQLLHEHKRYLVVVPNVGYRMIQSAEHLPTSLAKRDKAQRHLERGIDLLRNARLNELTEAQRTLHEGQLMILSGVYHAVQDSQKRHERAESLIEDLLKSNREIEERLERLEYGDDGSVQENAAKADDLHG